MEVGALYYSVIMEITIFMRKLQCKWESVTELCDSEILHECCHSTQLCVRSSARRIHNLITQSPYMRYELQFVYASWLSLLLSTASNSWDLHKQYIVDHSFSPLPMNIETGREGVWAMQEYCGSPLTFLWTVNCREVCWWNGLHHHSTLQCH